MEGCRECTGHSRWPGWEASTVPYVVAFIEQANQIFGPTEGFDAEALARMLEGVDSVRDAVERFELLDAIEGDQNRAVAAEFLQLLPPSLDAAVLAVVRSALARGLPIQFTWKPGYAFELGLWESSLHEEDKGRWVGLVNVLIVSPDPPEGGAAAAS
jgi:hypothetical protein